MTEDDVRADDGYEEIVEYLRALPEGTELRWADDHMSREKPWCTSWVDVRVPEIDAAAHTAWVWTILSIFDDDDPTDDPLTVMRVPFDIDVEGLWGPLPDGGDWYQDEVALEIGTAPQPEDAARWASKIVEDPRFQITRIGAWSPHRITTAITRWVEIHTGRTDLVFTWDPETVGPSEMLQTVVRRMQDVKDGHDSFDLGDGVKIHQEVADELLAMDPTDASALSAVIKDAMQSQPKPPDA